jgi:hypothetical protein
MADPFIMNIRINHRIRFAALRTFRHFQALEKIRAAVITNDLAVKRDKGISHPMPVGYQGITPVAALNETIFVKG